MLHQEFQVSDLERNTWSQPGATLARFTRFHERTVNEAGSGVDVQLASCVGCHVGEAADRTCDGYPDVAWWSAAEAGSLAGDEVTVLLIILFGAGALAACAGFIVVMARDDFSGRDGTDHKLKLFGAGFVVCLALCIVSIVHQSNLDDEACARRGGHEVPDGAPYYVMSGQVVVNGVATGGVMVPYQPTKCEVAS